MSEMKSTLDGTLSSLDIAEENISKLKDTANERQIEKKKKKRKKTISE